MRSNNRSRYLLKNTFIIAFGSIASKGIIFLLAPFFSRWLTVEEYGNFDILTTYVSLLSPFCTLSVSEAVFRFLLDDNAMQEKKKIIAGGLFVSGAGLLLFFFLYLFSALVCERIHVSINLCMLLCSQVLFSFSMETARGLKRIDLYAIFSLISVLLLSVFSTINILVFNLGLKGMVIGYTSAYFLSAIGILYAIKVHKVISFENIEKKSIFKMLQYSLPLIPNSISWWIVNVSDRLIINMFVDLAANGIYAIANKIPSIVNVLYSVFHLSWVQSASEAVSDEDYQEYCNTVLNKLIVFICCTCSILNSVNFIFYQYVFDRKYSMAKLYSPILIVAVGISCIGQFLGGIMIAKKETKQNGVTNLIAAFSNICVNIILIKWMGLFAASISTLVAYAILVGLRYVVIHKYIKFHMSGRSFMFFVPAFLCFAGAYFDNIYLEWIILFFAVVIFFIGNYDLVCKILNMKRSR